MIYIQSNKEKTLPHHFDAACALYGAIDSALDFRLASFEEVQDGKYDNLIRSNLFVGSVEFMREIFLRMGIADPRVPLNSDRTHLIMTIKEVREHIANGDKIFVKPTDIKLFTGLVVDQMTISCLKDLDENLKVMCYEPFESFLLSEWRVYVHNNKITDSRNYSGDFKMGIDYNYVDRIIQQYKSTFPCAYTIDVGIINNPRNENVVVEFNDMWAIGNYGVPNDIYLRMLKDRYFEIIKNGK